MKILHTSDWHIGRQLHNVSLLEDQVQVLKQIISIAEEQGVDVVLVSGDIFDRAMPPAAAVKVVDNVFDHLCRKLDLPVIVIAGNHDSPDRLAFGSRQLSSANLHITGSLSNEIEPLILNDEFGEVAFYSFPYTDPATVRELFDCDVQTHDEATKEVMDQLLAQKLKGRKVILSHCFVAGGSGCESERPLSIGGAEQVSAKHFKAFDYSALGHLHGQQMRSQENIRYSGSILKYSFSEVSHKKSVTLVHLDASGECETRQVALKPLHEMRVIEGYFDDLLEQGRTDEKSDDYLLLRLLDTEAILDTMGRLRDVYPNILHLERPGLMNQLNHLSMHLDQVKNSELEMVEDFYQQTSGNELSEAQKKHLIQILDRLKQED